MVLEKGFSYNNFVYDFVIQDGFIQPKNRLNLKIENVIKNTINPLKETSIFYDFVAINPSKDKDIIDFCNKNGLLGIGGEAILDSAGKPILNNGVEIKTYKEKISDFICEIYKMRAILDMKIALDKADFPLFKDKFLPFYEGKYINENLIEYIKRSKLDLNTFNFEKYPEHAIYSGYSLITILINKYIKHSVFPELQFDMNNLLYNGAWQSKNLIAAMYFEIFLEFSQNAKLRKCQDSTCPAYFKIKGNDLRKIYCNSETCGKRQCKRNERARKKSEKDKNNIIEGE